MKTMVNYTRVFRRFGGLLQIMDFPRKPEIVVVKQYAPFRGCNKALFYKIERRYYKQLVMNTRLGNVFQCFILYNTHAYTSICARTSHTAQYRQCCYKKHELNHADGAIVHGALNHILGRNIKHRCLDEVQCHCCLAHIYY